MFGRQPWFKKILPSLPLLLMLAACVPQPGAKIDPTAFYVDTDAQMQIPAVCKSSYEAAAATRVGIVDFTNYSYGRVIVPQGWFWWREVEMKLPETVADGVIDEIVNMGGAKVFTRTEMQKVIEEHKLQMSGLIDDKTLINFGKVAGLEYIITGSISNIGISQSMVMALLTRVPMPQMEIEIVIRMIDVMTGEIVLSKKVNGKQILQTADYVGAISGIKKASGKAIEDIRPEFSKRFTVKGYILQTRTSHDGKERAALINIGEKQGLKPGSKLIIYTFQEIKDPFTGRSTCDKVKLPVEAEVTDQIQEDKAWILISGDINQVRRVRTGALVERAPMEGQQFFKKLGF
ncbi:MAG: CsgG/HfaB family protein [Nitrospirota bacterium]